MDDTWHDFNHAYQTPNNREAVSDAGGGSDITSIDGAASTSNVCNERVATKREKDKEYKNKSRQKQADEKALLGLKCRLNEAEASHLNKKFNHVKTTISAVGRSTSCVYCCSWTWMQEVLNAAEEIPSEDPLDDMCRRFAELSADFVEKYGASPFQGRSFTSAVKSGRKCSRRDGEDHTQEAPESNCTKAAGPSTKKMRISEERVAWNFCPMCGYSLQGRASPLRSAAADPSILQAQPTVANQPLAAKGVAQALPANNTQSLSFNSAYNAPMPSTFDPQMASSYFPQQITRPTDLPIAQNRGGPSAWDSWMQ